MKSEKGSVRSERGSIILEASLVFPLVLLVMLAFGVLVRYFLVYETLQHGMYEATREMSAYYYLYSTTGLEDMSRGIEGTGLDAREQLDAKAKAVNATIANIQNIAGQLSVAAKELGEVSVDGISLDEMGTIESRAEEIYRSLNETGTSLRETREAVEQIMKSPLETITFLLKYGMSEGFTWAKNSVMNIISQALLSQHIPGGDLQRYAAAYGISDLNAAAAWDARQSGDVEMVLTYRFTIRLFGGYDFQVIQRTRARGWGTGV